MIKFFKKIQLLKLEVYATIAWFLTDFLWMWDQVTIALFLFPIIIVCMLVSISRVKGYNMKRILTITLAWLLMNSLWMLSDLFEGITVFNLKLLASAFGLVGLIQLFVFFITKPKNIQNFKRSLNINYEA